MQVCLFTATMPDSVTEQSKKWLRRAVRCRSKGKAAAQAISSTVVQVPTDPPGPEHLNVSVRQRRDRLSLRLLATDINTWSTHRPMQRVPS